MKVRLFKCKVCGQIVAVINDTNLTMRCCMRDMEELIPASVDASKEKHVPVSYLNGQVLTVKVGAQPHPMTDEHHIEWIGLESSKGIYIMEINRIDAPEYTFSLAEGEVPKAVFAYCNLHGLWKKEI